MSVFSRESFQWVKADIKVLHILDKKIANEYSLTS